jgi:hypothetical protein
MGANIAISRFLILISKQKRKARNTQRRKREAISLFRFGKKIEAKKQKCHSRLLCGSDIHSRNALINYRK